MAQAPQAAPGDPACAGCHDVGDKLKTGAHAAVPCGTCHVKHEEYPHPEKAPKPVCGSCHMGQQRDYSTGVHGQAAKSGNAGAPDCGVCHGPAHEMKKPASVDFRKGVPDTCGMCHTEVVDQFKASVHGQAVAAGIPQAPICTDCHGEHSILAPKNENSPVHASHVRDTCARCHGDVRLAARFGLPPDRVASFDDSFHGLAAKSGSETVANCASCHGVHNILPSKDPKSMIHPKNLAATCGHCHKSAGSRFALGKIHWTGARGEPAGVRYARLFYIGMIPLTIGLMLLHNAGDWIRKLYKLRLRPGGPPAGAMPSPVREFRMSAFERVQHFCLLSSFLTLVWTGFALKYPDQWWARPLLLWEGQFSLRGVVHRSAGVLFIVVAVMHLVSLIVSKRLRDHWKEMLPVRGDIPEAIGNLLYNLGLKSSKEPLSQHSYVEKAEYWAVVWGAVVMIVTGALLWGNTLALQFLPKDVLDFFTAVHFYEALLATLAIAVWHFYFVFLDPEVYPMDPAWLTGFSIRRRKPHAHAAPAKAETPAPPAAASEPITTIGNK